MTFWGLERINGSSIVLYGEICFEIRVIQDTSKVAERIKLVCRGTTVYRLQKFIQIYYVFGHRLPTAKLSYTLFIY